MTTLAAPEVASSAPKGRSVRRRKVRRSMLTLSAAVAATATALFAGGAFGAWTSTVARSQSVSFATMTLNLTDPTVPASSSLTTTFGPAVRGDFGTYYVGLNSPAGNATLASFTMGASMGTVTDTFGTAPTSAAYAGALNVGLQYCTGTWGGAANASSCTGGTGWANASATATTTVSALGTPLALTNIPNVAPGGTVGLKLVLTMSASADTVIMGASAPITWTVAASAANGTTGK
jgi:hypothetical protein